MISVVVEPTVNVYVLPTESSGTLITTQEKLFSEVQETNLLPLESVRVTSSPAEPLTLIYKDPCVDLLPKFDAMPDASAASSLPPVLVPLLS